MAAARPDANPRKHVMPERPFPPRAPAPDGRRRRRRPPRPHRSPCFHRASQSRARHSTTQHKPRTAAPHRTEGEARGPQVQNRNSEKSPAANYWTKSKGTDGERKLPFPRFKNPAFSFSSPLFPVLNSSSLPPPRLPSAPFFPSLLPSFLFSHALPGCPLPSSYGLHGRRCGPRPRPPRRRLASVGSSCSCAAAAAAAAPQEAPQLLLPHAQLGHPPPPPLFQKPRLVASAGRSGYPVPGQGEGPPFRGWRCRRRFAPAPPSAALEPPHPTLRHRRTPRRGTRRRARCCGGACARAPRGYRQAGVFHRPLQGGDRRGLRVVPRDAPPAPAQEAPSHGAAPDRLAVPWILPSGCHAGNVQDRGEVTAIAVEIHIIKWEGMQMCWALLFFDDLIVFLFVRDG